MRKFIDLFESQDTDLREGPVRDRRVSVVTQTGDEPRYLYRIMSRAEYVQAHMSGFLTSREGRVHASGRPLFEYCEPGTDNVLVRIDYHFEDGWRAKHTGIGVVAIADEVPMDHVQALAKGSRDALEATFRSPIISR